MVQEWRIDRAFKKRGYTISRVFLDGKRFGDGKNFCNCLEDEDRNLSDSMTTEQIWKLKKKGSTAIPTGRYKVEMTYSPRFKRDLPLLIGVKGYEGVRIHSGNTSDDTEGCLLFGRNDKIGMVSNSRYWTSLVIGIIKAAIARGEDVYITVG